MSGSLTVAVAREGHKARLAHVACTLGRHDKPYLEAHEPAAWTIALVRRGSFRYRGASTNTTHELRPGFLLLGPPGAAFECSHDRDGGDDCSSLTLSEDLLADVASASSVPLPKLLRSAPVQPPSPRVSALLERARARDRSDIDEVGYLVAEALVAHATGTPAAEVARHPSHTGRVHDAMDRIEASCREPISLVDIADSVGLSPFHFIRVFRQVTGTTPHQYLVGARLRLAARLLLDTDRPVTEIALDCGFQDLSNFTRTFHKVIGSPPGAFRRR